jgi:peptidoglycan/xylan/chitin deacetylase (PgdA/CDA1 family)
MRTILTYHSVDDSGSPISTSRADFTRHVKWLTSGVVRVVPLETLLHLPSDSDAVAITFDDGIENFATFAAPMLLERGLPVTLFVVTDSAGTNNQWQGSGTQGIPCLRLLEWSVLAHLAEQGVAIGSHTCTHPILTRVERQVLNTEIQRSAARIQQEIGAPPRHFAYPFGQYNEAVMREAGRVYTTACTTDFRVFEEAEDPLALPRLDAVYFREEGRLEKWGTPEFRSYLRVRHTLRGLRAAIAGRCQ